MRVAQNGQSVALSAKEKRYQTNVDKALQAFDSVDEWADYIAFLGKLQKALRSNSDAGGVQWVPMDFQVATTMAKCISSKLPSGVHRKAIEVYATIFDILGDSLASYVNIWLPGVFPLMTYASISVKPELIDLYEKYLLKLPSPVLRTCIKPLLLSLLPAIDDTTSEFFDPVLDLIDKFKLQLDDDVHFWQCLFLCVITSPDRRAGVMEYFNKRLPVFLIPKDEEEDGPEGAESEQGENEGENAKTPEHTHESKDKGTIISLLSSEAKSCVIPESGLLVKSFCEALKDDNLYVQRGFFDLLLSRLPLNSPVFQSLINDSNKELLILSAASTILRRDMSLNRRLWNWLLGPTTPSNETTGSGSNTDEIRMNYFKKYGQNFFTKSLMDLIDGKSNDGKHIDQIIKASKILMAIMDKWEIGVLIIPVVFIPIIESIRVSRDSNQLSEDEFIHALKVSNELFDGVETNIIWSNIFQCINDKRLDLAMFILENYNVDDEDMVAIHAPLILLQCLSIFDYDMKSIKLIQFLSKMIPQRALLPLDLCGDRYKKENFHFEELKDKILEKLNVYYNSDRIISDSNTESRPFGTDDITVLYLNYLTKILINSYRKQSSELFFNISEFANSLLDTIPPNENEHWNCSEFIQIITKSSKNDADVFIAFGISDLFKHLIVDLSTLQRANLFKVTLDLLWGCLINISGKYQSEIVYKIWNLEHLIGSKFVEAGICKLLLSCDPETRIKAFNILWTHSNNDNESNDILVRPLFIVLDDLNDQIYFSLVQRWIASTINTGSLNKLFKIVCMELFHNFLSDEESSFADFDFRKMAYEMNVIMNLLKSNVEDILKNFNNELCIIDNDKQIETIRSLKWDISTYKSFLILVLVNFLKMDITTDLTNDLNCYNDYLKCVKISISLLETLIDGSETHFEKIVKDLTTIVENTCVLNIPNGHLIISYYLNILTQMMKLSSKKQIKVSLFEVPKTANLSINLLDFVLIGINNCKSSIEISCWFNFILKTSEYFSELVFLMTNGLTNCICNKAQLIFLERNDVYQDYTTKVNEFEDSISELILGLENVLINSHKYLGYITSSNLGFGGIISNAGTSKEAGFFGSVIQGVFQVEAADEKDEFNRRKLLLFDSFYKSITEFYKVWVWSDDKNSIKTISNKDNDDGLLKKTNRYRAHKLKFRCKKLIENLFLLEPLEIIETLIKCCGIQNRVIDQSGLKIIQILDESKQTVILPYILNSLVSRVHYSSLDEENRSSLMIELSETDISKFLVIYAEQLSKDRIEEVWEDIISFLKTSFSNPTNYKHVYPDILVFIGIIGNKFITTSIASTKKVKKELSESFIKTLNYTLTLKAGSLPEDNNSSHESNNAEELTTLPSINPEKVVFRSEVCQALKSIIPIVNVVLGGDNDKLQSCFNSIINSLSNSIFKNHQGVVKNVSQPVLTLLIAMGKNSYCASLKLWKGLCYDLITDSDFFKLPIHDESNKWNELMKVWIVEDENRLMDMINNKITMVGPSGNSGTLLFNWNDEVDILNSNVPIIKRVAYLILINKKDELIKILANLVDSMINFFRAFKQITKTCQMQSTLFILMRVLILKFNEIQLVDLWPLIYKEIYLSFDELAVTFSNMVSNDNDDSTQSTSEVDLESALQVCKLFDVLTILEPEEFQLSEWVFVNNTTDGIYGGSKSIRNTLIEKINETKRSRKPNGGSSLAEKNSTAKIPMLAGVSKIGNFEVLRDFFVSIKVQKYENEYELKKVDYSAIERDLFADLFQWSDVHLYKAI